MDIPIFHSLVAYLNTHPHIGGLIAFAMAFIESVPLVGGLIPGAVILAAMGMLIGSGILPVVSTFVWVMVGAFLGDYFSYSMGSYYNERLRKMWPFSRYPRLLHESEKFFKAHGGKSVFIGRFIGLVRGTVALVAGLVHMPIRHFITAALPAAILWSALYIVPGILIGALSLELPPDMAAKFILIVLVIVACSSFFLIGIDLFLRRLLRASNHLMQWLWCFFQKHRITSWLTTWLNPFQPSPHAYRQLNLLFFVLICGALFIWILCSVLTQTGLASWNQPLFALLRSLRDPIADNVMIMMTLLGDKYVQLIAVILLFMWFIWKRYWWLAVHWVVVACLSVGMTELMKALYFSPRPIGILHQQLSSGFPSGHTMLVTSLFGFLAMVLACHVSSEKRRIPLTVSGILILAVGFSRLYLGAHWLTDVLASLFLGSACAGLVFLSYVRASIGDGSKNIFLPQKSCKAGKALYSFCHRYAKQPFSVKKTAWAIVIIFSLVWIGYGATQFQRQQENYTLYWPTVSLDTASWWKKPYPETPLFILSRLGEPRAALNVQWLGSLDTIRDLLLANGWKAHPIHLDWREKLSHLSPKTNPQSLPLLAALYQNQLPVLIMTKTSPDRPSLHFTLWRSNITLSDSNETVWVGSVYYVLPLKINKWLDEFDPNHQIYPEAEKTFMEFLHQNKLKWQVWKISKDQQPAVMKKLNWDGKLILIQ